MGILEYIETAPVDFQLEGESFHFDNLLEAEKAGFSAFELIAGLVNAAYDNLGGEQ